MKAAIQKEVKFYKYSTKFLGNKWITKHVTKNDVRSMVSLALSQS